MSTGMKDGRLLGWATAALGTILIIGLFIWSGIDYRIRESRGDADLTGPGWVTTLSNLGLALIALGLIYELVRFLVKRRKAYQQIRG